MTASMDGIFSDCLLDIYRSPDGSKRVRAVHEEVYSIPEVSFEFNQNPEDAFEEFERQERIQKEILESRQDFLRLERIPVVLGIDIGEILISENFVDRWEVIGIPAPSLVLVAKCAIRSA